MFIILLVLAARYFVALVFIASMVLGTSVVLGGAVGVAVGATGCDGVSDGCGSTTAAASAP
jgi:hypothetical protein